MKEPLAKREKEAMDILFRLGRATVSEVRGHMPDPPSYSAVRATLRVLEEKGHVRHEHDANRYVYIPTEEPGRAAMSALEHLLDTFFDGSAERAVTALMESRSGELSSKALERISRLIEQARKEGR